MTGSQWHHNRAPAPTLHFRSSNNCLLRIIAALDDHVGPEMSDQIERSIVGENYDEIHAFERGEEVGALGIAAHGTCGPFETADRIVAVDANDESLCCLTSGREDVDVPAV